MLYEAFIDTLVMFNTIILAPLCVYIFVLSKRIKKLQESNDKIIKSVINLSDVYKDSAVIMAKSIDECKEISFQTLLLNQLDIEEREDQEKISLLQ